MTDIAKKCQDCYGTGMRKDMFGEDTIPCNICTGTGKIIISTFDISNLENTVNDILDKCNDIFEKVSE